MSYYTVPIGEIDWIVLTQVGTKYLVVSEAVLFNGFYAAKGCPYHKSNLNDYLTRKFLPKIAAADVDMNKISGLSILSKGQFDQFVKDKLPDTAAPYMLLTPYPDRPDYIFAVTKDGLPYPHYVADTCGIRPCLYIDKKYADSLLGIDEDIDRLNVAALTEIYPTDDELRRLEPPDFGDDDNESTKIDKNPDKTETKTDKEEKPDTQTSPGPAEAGSKVAHGDVSDGVDDTKTPDKDEVVEPSETETESTVQPEAESNPVNDQEDQSEDEQDKSEQDDIRGTIIERISGVQNRWNAH